MNAYFSELVASGRFGELKAKWEASDGAQVMDPHSFSSENGTLRIATLGTWSPMSFYASEELTGLFVELAAGFCEAAGYTPVFTAMPYVSEIAGLNAGEYDVIADNIARTQDRLESINITEPLFSDHAYVFVPAVTESVSSGGTESFLSSLAQSFEKNLIREDRWKLLLSGLGTTVALSLLAGLFGTLLGALICYLTMGTNELGNAFADLYMRLFRGIPIVVLLLVLNYLVFASADFPAFWVCVIAFSLDFAAYVSEIFRKGIEAVHL